MGDQSITGVIFLLKFKGGAAKVSGLEGRVAVVLKMNNIGNFE